MNEVWNQKRKAFYRKIAAVLVFAGAFLALAGCGSNKNPQKTFANDLTKAESYRVEGVMESYYDTGRKRNDFIVFYKKPEKIKVVIKPEGNNDKQIILKNQDGVYVLIPAVNKNFKIQSDWPNNASYPYLLQSIAKDIANDPQAIIKQDDTGVIIDTKTKMHADATPVRQKIIFNPDTNLPTEVLVYDENDNLYIRTVFSKIDLGFNIPDTEFNLDTSMTTVRAELGDDFLYENREIAYPTYIPEGITLVSENTTRNLEGTEVLSVMKYGSGTGFTVIQEFVNDREARHYQEEKGDILMVLGNVAILKETSLLTVYQGIEYTVASTDISIEEMTKIVQSFLIDEEGK